MKKLALTFVLAATLLSSSAFAEGLVPVSLAAKDRAALSQEVAKAKATNPKVFADLLELRAQFPEMDKNKRGRFAPVTKTLGTLGADGLYPMLELLAFGADTHADLGENGFDTWRAGLIEAVGRLRDPRAARYLTAAVETGPADNAFVIEAAGAALGRLRTEESVVSLERASRSPERRVAAVVGLGEVRRIKATQLLAGFLAEERRDSKSLRATLRALGTAGSSWAWDTLGGSDTAEAEEVRLISAKALADACGRFSGEVREEAFVALSMTEQRDVVRLLEQVKQRGAADQDGLSALITRARTLKLH